MSTKTVHNLQTTFLTVQLLQTVANETEDVGTVVDITAPTTKQEREMLASQYDLGKKQKARLVTGRLSRAREAVVLSHLEILLWLSHLQMTDYIDCHLHAW